MSEPQLSHSAYELYQDGCEAMQSGQRDLAIDLFRQSALRHPHFKTCELLGECLLVAERPGEATLYLAAAIGLGWRQSRARYLMARALLALPEPEALDAARHLREAVRLNPGYKAAQELFADLLVRDSSL